MTYIAHTLIWLTVSFVFPNHKQFIRVNRMLYIAHAFICLPVSFVPPHRKQLIELNRMPCIAHATKIWTMFDASSIAKVFHLFWWLFYTTICELRLLHHTQFHRRVYDRSVALAASCSSASWISLPASPFTHSVMHHPATNSLVTLLARLIMMCITKRAQRYLSDTRSDKS